MESYSEIKAYELAGQIKSGEITAEEVAKNMLGRIEEKNSAINAYITVQPELVIEEARAVDKKINNGLPTGELAGVPVAIKDAICTKNLETTCGSKILEGFIPPYDASVITRLRDCLLYTSPSPRDGLLSRMPSSA